jgi:single-stranded DNA-specific DHH superfamily exonuclease
LTGREIRWLRHFQPCGAACAEPTFLSRKVLVADARPIGSDSRHLRLKLRDGAVVWPAIAFRRGDFEVNAGQMVDIVYSVAPDNREDGLELRLHDLRLSDE